MSENIVLVQFFGGIIVIVLSNFFAVKHSLNGLRDDVVEVKTDVKKLLENDAEQDTNIALNKQGLQDITGRLDRNRRKEDHER